MPSIPTRLQQPSPVAPQVELPAEFPDIPSEVLERFPSARQWQQELNSFWTRTKQSIQTAQTQAANYANARVVYSVDTFLIYAKNGIPEPMFALDSTGVKLGDVLVINTPGRKMYIGEGVYADDGTPFYVDTLGFFSLGSSLTWNPETDTLAIIGTITATSGTIGGFSIGADYIRDNGNSFGLSSNVVGPTDVRIWAGTTFANRNTAPFRVYSDGDTYVQEFHADTVFVSDAGVESTTALLVVRGVSTAAGGSGEAVDLHTSVTASVNADFLKGFRNRAEFNKSNKTGLSAAGDYVTLSTATGTGTIDNAYGIYIDTVNIGTANWGLYVATTAPNYMAGALNAVGQIQFDSLAGVGTRNVVADASGVLSAP